MESLGFAINAVAPIVAMVALGYFLKRFGILGKDFAKAGNRLVFKIFLPVMLFTNVYKIENLKSVDLSHVFYSVFTIILIFIGAMFLSAFVTKEGPKRGSLAQGIFRSNYALIGIPLAGSLFGEEGIAAAAVLSAFVIPLFNMELFKADRLRGRRFFVSAPFSLIEYIYASTTKTPFTSFVPTL